VDSSMARLFMMGRSGEKKLREVFEQQNQGDAASKSQYGCELVGEKLPHREGKNVFFRCKKNYLPFNTRELAVPAWEIVPQRQGAPSRHQGGKETQKSRDECLGAERKNLGNLETSLKMLR